MRIHHVALRTPDPERLSEFYREALGLEEVARHGERSIWLRAGDVLWMIERSSADEPAPSAASMEIIALAIEPSERLARRRALESRGVVVEAETAYTLYFRDPEGRRVGLSHYPSPLPP
jgi:catechol 2,3-dioxygenase-like lactoylglutathione lyase family enzyme